MLASRIVSTAQRTTYIFSRLGQHGRHPKLSSLKHSVLSMKMQFSLKTLLALLVFSCLVAGFLSIAIRQRNELRELRHELIQERETSKRIASFHSAVVELKAERKEIVDKWFEAHPSVKRLDAKIQQLEKEIPQLWEMAHSGD